MKHTVKSQIYEKFKEISDENTAWILHSLYMDYPVDGPYITNESGRHGGKPACRDHKTRGLYKQIFHGAYGPAGIVYSIEGSPPRGIIYVSERVCIFENIFGFKPKIIIKNMGTRNIFMNDLSRYFFFSFEEEEINWRGKNETREPDYKYKSV